MLAIALSLAAAVAFAASALYIDSMTGKVGPLQVSRWQMGLAFLMTGALCLFTGGWRTIDLEMALWLLASSASGIMLGSLTFIAVIQITGPRISALLFTTAAPFALALGYIFRGETVTLAQGAGVALIVGGIAMAVAGPRSDEGTRVDKPLWLGVALGLLTALAQATGSLFARPAMLAGADPVAAIAVRTGFATLFFVALLALPSLRPAGLPDRRSIGRLTGAAFAGMALGMSLLMAALARGDVGIVTTMSSTTPILILPMVWALYGRKPHWAAWIGAGLAVSGTALISLMG